METALAEAERLYLEGLMSEPDADEGIRAFIEKREPRWAHS
jgi:enoyl-CoA hydratase/carnithine racemase